MTQPNVTITELDGALGLLPNTAGRLHAIIGVSSSGPTDTPATYARIPDVQTDFGDGPMVEAAAHYIENYAKPVALVRTAASVAATISAVSDFAADGTAGATGTSVVTASGTPVDDRELALRVITGGTIGTAGIIYQTSQDAGRTWSADTALDVAATAAIGDSGASFDFAAGTLVADESYTALATAAKWNTTELQAALTALKNSLISWEIVQICGAIDSSEFDTVETAIAGMVAAGKYRAWVGHTRIPTVGETEAAYLTAMTALSAAKSTKYGALTTGGCKLTSSVSARKYRRPPSYLYAAREAASSEEVNNAAPILGALTGVSIRDVNGNADEHDESINPGLDDLRYVTLRTLDGYPGVYINRPRLFAPAGSDFEIMPHRRVMNLAHDALRVYFIKRLNLPILVSKTTGLILESEALEIELGALAAMRDKLLAKPKASDCMFTLSRTDNLLSTKTMNGDARVLPLAYAEFINLTVGFYNPALKLQAV